MGVLVSPCRGSGGAPPSEEGGTVHDRSTSPYARSTHLVIAPAAWSAVVRRPACHHPRFCHLVVIIVTDSLFCCYRLIAAARVATSVA